MINKMTWAEWKAADGNGLSAWSTHFVVQKWGPEREWDGRTLDEIMDSAPCVRRELGKHMKENAR